MIRIIVQRRVNTKHSLYERIKCLHDVFDISWFKAIKLSYQIHKGYGIVINTLLPEDGPYVTEGMNSLYSRLHRVFETHYKLQTGPFSIPRDKYKMYLVRAGYRVNLALKKGYIDYNLEIY